MEENNQVESTGSKKWLVVGIMAVVIVGVFLIFSFVNREVDITGEVVDTETSFEGEEMEDRLFHVTTLEWEPHVYTAPDGSVKGISADVVSRALTRIGVPHEIVLVPWTRSIKLVEDGNAEAILVASYNKERISFLYFTDEEKTWDSSKDFPLTSVSSADNAFFARKAFGDTVALWSLDKIIEMEVRVGVMSTYSYVPTMKEQGYNLVEFFEIEEGFKALDAGEVDVFVIEKAVGLAVIRNMELNNEFISPFSYAAIPLYMPFSKYSDYPNIDEIRVKFLEEVRKIHESGEFDEIYRKYTQ